jgi:hypothetical protein
VLFDELLNQLRSVIEIVLSQRQQPREIVPGRCVILQVQRWHFARISAGWDTWN